MAICFIVFPIIGNELQPDVVTTKEQDDKANDLLTKCQENKNESCLLEVAHSQGVNVALAQAELYRHFSPEIRSYLYQEFAEFEKAERQQYGSIPHEHVMIKIKSLLNNNNQRIRDLIEQEQQINPHHQISINKLNELTNSLIYQYKIWSILNFECQKNEIKAETCENTFISKSLPEISYSPRIDTDSMGENSSQINYVNKAEDATAPLSDCNELFVQYNDVLNDQQKTKLPSEYKSQRDQLLSCINWCLNDKQLIEKFPKFCAKNLSPDDHEKRSKFISFLTEDTDENYRLYSCNWANNLPATGESQDYRLNEAEICQSIRGTGLEIFEENLIYELGGAASEIGKNYIEHNPGSADLVSSALKESGLSNYPAVVRKVAFARTLKAFCYMDAKIPKLPKACEKKFGKIDLKNYCADIRPANYENIQENAQHLILLYQKRREVNKIFSDARFDAIVKSLLHKLTLPENLINLYYEYQQLQQTLAYLDNQIFEMVSRYPILLSDFKNEEKSGTFQEQDLDLDKKSFLYKIANSDDHQLEYYLSKAKKKSTKNIKETLGNVCEMDVVELINRGEFTGPTLEMFPTFSSAHQCYANLFDIYDLKNMAKSAGPGLSLLCLPLALGGPPGLYMSFACGAAYTGYSKLVYDDNGRELKKSQECFKNTGNWDVCDLRSLQKIKEDYELSKNDFYLSSILLPVEGIALAAGPTKRYILEQIASNDALAAEMAIKISQLRMAKSKEAKKIISQIWLEDKRLQFILDPDDYNFLVRNAKYKNPNASSWTANIQDITYHNLDIYNKTENMGFKLRKTDSDGVLYNNLVRDPDDFKFYEGELGKLLDDSVELEKFRSSIKTYEFDLPTIINDDQLIKKLFHGIPSENLDDMKKQLKYFLDQGYSLQLDSTCKFSGCGGYYRNWEKIISMPSPPYAYSAWIHEFQHLTLYQFLTYDEYNKLIKVMAKNPNSDEAIKAWTAFSDKILKSDFYGPRDLERIRQATLKQLPYNGLHELLSTGKEIDFLVNAKNIDDKIGYLTLKNVNTIQSNNRYVVNHTRSQLLEKVRLNQQEQDLLNFINKKEKWAQDKQFSRDLLVDISYYSPGNLSKGLIEKLKIMKTKLPQLPPNLLLDGIIAMEGIEILEMYYKDQSLEKVYLTNYGQIKVSENGDIFVLNKGDIIPEKIADE